jgi:cation-transporting ATPase E
MPPLTGLSEAEVAARRAAGQTNQVDLPTSRTYFEILRENVFTFINGVFFIIAIVLVVLNMPQDALTVSLIIVGSSSVNLFQEIQAKRKLDKIALLTRPKITALRAGQRQSIAPDEIVLGDVLWVEAGDQIVVDGRVVGQGRIDVDESLLTGESNLIPKQAGDEVHSGSFCVTGSAAFEATKVGTDTLAHQLTASARAFRREYTPVQREIRLIIQILLLLATFLWILYGVSYLVYQISLEEVVQIAAVVAGLVPAGLYLAITLAYALGAVRLAGENAVIQQSNAVESLSNVDVLCLDKTGTLTSNRITLQTIHPLATDEAEVRQKLGDFAASISASNRTNEALRQACGGAAQPTLAEVPFSSARKWSALTFKENESEKVKVESNHTTYVLGAPEMLAAVVALDEAQQQLIQAGAAQGLRVLLFAAANGSALYNKNHQPQLPAGLTSLAILFFGDELRANMQETLASFGKAGVAIKIISGDNPDTVAALATQAGLGPDLKVISGLELAQIDEAQLGSLAQEYTIFGRVTPEQKSKLVRSLRQQGSYVAMTGDGVNDVLSLKQANLSIAMESGSQVTRSVADILLLKDSFSALPHAFLEGQRIRNGVQDVLSLFLVRIFTLVLLIFAIELVTGTFPLSIRQNAIIASLVVGIPTIGMALWAKPGQPPRRSMARSTLQFMAPTTLSLALVGLFVYLAYFVVALSSAPVGPDGFIAHNVVNDLLIIPRSALVTVFVMGGLLLNPFLKPPTRFWVACQPLSGDWRYSLTALAMFIIYLVILLVPQLRIYADLAWLGWLDYALLSLIILVWAVGLRLSWQRRFLDRFLGVDLT